MKKLVPNVILSLGLLAALQSVSATDRPLGEISANSQIVRAGEFPKLDWNIVYPGINTMVDITPEGEVIPKQDVTMQVRTLAADVQQRRTSSNGSVSFNYIWVTGYGVVNNTNWQLLFNGTQPMVNPSEIVWSKDLEEGDEVRFAARANYSGGKWYYSAEGSPNVILLKDGDIPPLYSTWSTQSTLGTHISAYLSDDGKVDIGPRDVIVVFELTHVMDPNSNSNGGDMQDMIFLLTFQSNES